MERGEGMKQLVLRIELNIERLLGSFDDLVVFGGYKFKVRLMVEELEVEVRIIEIIEENFQCQI